MELNDSQKLMCQVAVGFIIQKLDGNKGILEKSKTSKSTLNAACLSVHLAGLCKRDNFEAVLNKLYPEDTYKIVRDIFLVMHDVINLVNPNSSFVKDILDPDFFPDDLNAKDYLPQLQEASMNFMKHELGEWLEDKYKQKIVDKTDILALAKKYNPPALASDATAESANHP